MRTRVPLNPKPGDTWFDGKHTYCFDGRYWREAGTDMHKTRKWNEGYFIVREQNNKQYYFVDVRLPGNKKGEYPAAIWNANEIEARAYSTEEDARDDVYEFELRNARVIKKIFDL